MATTGGATGFVLHIDDDLITKLGEADGKIQDLAKHSEDTRDRVIAAFKEMGDKGVQYFIDKLKTAQQQLNNLAGKEVKVNVSGVENIGQTAAKSADEVVNLTTNIEKLSTKAQEVDVTNKLTPNIGQLKAEIDSINKQLNDANSQLTINEQQNLVNRREALKQLVSEQQKSTDQRKKDAKSIYVELHKMRKANLQELVADVERQDEIRKQDANRQLQANAKIREAQLKKAKERVNVEASESAKETEELQKQYEIQLDISKAKMESYAREVDNRKKLETAQEEERKKNLEYLNERYKEEQKEIQKAEKEKTKIEEQEAKERIRRRQQIQKQNEVSYKQDLQKEKEIQREREAVWRQGFINYDKNEREKTKIQKEQAEQRAKDAAKAKEDFNKTYIGAFSYSQSANSYKEERKAIEYLKAARDDLKSYDVDYLAKKDAINAAIQRLTQSLKNQGLTEQQIAEQAKQAADKKTKAIEKETAARERLNKQQEMKTVTSSVQNAMQYSAEAKSINEQVKAIKYLKIVRDDLKNTNMTEKQYNQTVKSVNEEIVRQQKEVDRLRGKQEQLAKSHRNLMDISGQLQRRLALVFSVSQISGYIRKLADVRGEFELQQKSLQVLLQSRDQADKLWQQTVQLAVQSPFRVSELVSYTRQLAAYRIETGKLFDTTKRLADVSAGLGVDMSRLILAYGQVRAANYLRGTELRQFTEAGIPMLDELAKRFSIMENKAVSAGDVFERISKRMVSFKDVEAVFKSMTDAGGTFYKMQEEQSTTLKGMISNLHDSIDIMLNDIGKTNDGVMKGAVETAKYVVEHWEMMAEVLKAVVFSYGAYRLALLRTNKNLIALATELEVVTAAEVKSLTVRQLGRTVLAKFNKTLKETWSLLKANPKLTAFVAVLYMLYKIGSAWNEHRMQLEDIRRRYAKLQKQVSDITFNFNMAKSQQSIDEQKKALQSLIDLAKNEYNIVIDVDMTGIDAEETAKTFNEIKNHLSTATVYANEFAEAWTRATHWVMTDDINEDLKQLSDVSQRTYNTLISNLALVATKMRENYSQLSEAQREALKQMETPQKPDETPLQYLNRLILAYQGVTSEYDRYQEKVQNTKPFDASFKRYVDERDAAKAFLQQLGVFELNIGQLTHNLDIYRQEAQREYDKFVNENKGLFDKIMATADEKQRTEYIKIAIDKVASQNEWDDFEKQYIQEWISKQFKIKFVMDPANQQEILQQWQETYNKKFAGYEGFKEITESATKQKEIIDRINESLTEQQKLIDSIERAGTGKDTAYEGTKLADEQKKLAQLKEQLTWLGGAEKNKNAGKDWFAELAKNIKDANKEFASLNKTFDTFTAKQMTIEKFKGVFEETLAALRAKKVNIDLGELDFTTEEGAIDALKLLKKRLPESAYKSRVEIEKALSDIKGEFAVTVKKSNDEKLKRDVQKIFDKYSLFLELKKINVPNDMAKQLFDIDATDLEEVKRKLEELKPQFKGKEMEKMYQEYVDKVTEMEAQAQIERAKTYVSYLLKTQSEAVKIKLEELRQIQEIEKTFDAKKAKSVKDALRKETQQKLQKQQWADFKNSDMYSLMFDNLEYMGTTAIEVLYSKLEQLKGSLSDLPADSVKDIMTQINKLEKIKVERNPFKALRESLEEINNLQSVGKTEEYLQHQLAVAESEQRAAQEKLDTIDLILNAQDKELLKTEMGAEWTEKNNKYLSMTTAELEGSRALYSSIVSEKKKEVAEAANGQAAYADQRDSLEKLQAQWVDIRNTFNDVSSSVMGALEAAGVDADSMAMSFVQMGSDMIDVVLQAIQMHFQLQLIQAQAAGVATTMDTILGVVGWIALALQGVSKLFSALFSIGDKKKQKEIEKIQDQVDALTKSYERLSTAVDEAFDLAELQKDAQAANKNLQSQIAKYNQMIALEEAKKKTDKDKINEWRDKIASLQDEIAENNKKIFSTATDGIVDSVLEASRQFTNAWLEAFQETGQGLTGLESEFKDMMQNLVKQQASMLITQKYVDAWKTSLEQFINPKDLELTTDEARRWVSTVTSSLPQLNQALKNYFDAMQMAGVDLSGDKSGDQMSGLQRGIESLSEATGEILASYLNSIRFFVSEQNSILSNIANSLGATNANNPMLGELKLHTELIRSIRDGLNSMMRGGHRLGGMGLKIFMD